MKNLSNLMLRGNLTPRERYLLLVQNEIQKTKTGKDMLSLAEKDALENWRAKDNEEAREWNRLNDVWKHTGRMEIEAEFVYNDARVAYLSLMPIIMKLFSYPIHSKMAGCIKSIKQLKKVSIDEAVKIAGMQKAAKLKDGLDFDYAVYKLAFQNLKPEDREKFKELYSDIETDHQYLDQEEIIANLFNGKTELSHEAKEKLSEMVAERSYNKFAKEYQLFHYFACIPLLEVARHFLKDHGVEIKGKPMAKNQESDDEDSNTCDDITKAMEIYAFEHDTTVQKMLKQACSRWLNDLMENYMPLVISNSADLLQRWILSKAEATAILNKHIKSGELKIREHTEKETLREKLYSKSLYDSEYEAARKVIENIGMEITTKGEIDEKKAFVTFEGAVITGDSLYAFKENYDFVKEFKERADKYDPNLGLVYADDDPEHKGDHLDQELMVCDIDNKGEASFFSVFGMSINMLDGLIDGDSLFEEVSEGGKRVLKFDSTQLEKSFRERQGDLIAGYTKLLAFQQLFKKISKIYEVDIDDHVTSRIKTLREFMEQNNEAFYQAANISTDKSAKKLSDVFRRKEILKIPDGLIIEIDSIKPDIKSIEEHVEKLKGIYGDF